MNFRESCIYEMDAVESHTYVYITCLNINETTIGETVDDLRKVSILRRINKYSFAISSVPQFQVNLYKIQNPRSTYFQLGAHQIHFADGQMRQHWYRGEYEFNILEIHTDHVDVIHANAFNEPAFKDLISLLIYAKRSSVIIHDGALNGTFGLYISIAFRARSVRLPNGLFNSNSNKFRAFKFDVWPYGNNLNEMFVGETFGGLQGLEIRNVELPQQAFRLLHATNFTAFRHLHDLFLINCGIEEIDSHAFSEVGRTLKWLKLDRNWIKVFEFETFRIFFETKSWMGFSVDYNRHEQICTCRLFEFDLMSYPFGARSTIYIKCEVADGFTTESCGIERIINPSKLRLDWKKKILLRVINIRMTYMDDSIRIETNFTGKMRMLFRHLSDVNGKCGTKSKYKCLNINKRIDNLKLNVIEEIDHAEIVSITAIPILYVFGAKPIHSMTVRREAAIDDWLYGCVTMIIVTAGLVFGLATPFSIRAHKKSNVEMTSQELTIAPYDYAIPMNVNYTHTEQCYYNEIAERRCSDNYVEVTDTGYVAVL